MGGLYTVQTALRLFLENGSLSGLEIEIWFLSPVQVGEKITFPPVHAVVYCIFHTFNLKKIIS